MPMRALALTLMLCLGPAALAQAFPAAVQRSSATSSTLSTTETTDVQVGLKAPTFAGLYVEGPQLVIQVTDDRPASRAAVLKVLLEHRGADLKAQGLDTERPRFEVVQYSALQLAQAKDAASGIRGWTSIGVSHQHNRVIVALALSEYLQPAQAHLKAQGIPLDIVVFSVPRPEALPAHTTWSVPHRTALQVPNQVAQGDILPINFWFTFTGGAPLDFDAGLCASLKWQIKDAAGKVVRPAPGNVSCADVRVIKRLQPGASVNLTRPDPASPGEYWDLRDPFGKALPPGKYTLQAAFGQGDRVLRPADVGFTILPAAPDGGVEQALKAFWFGNSLGAPERTPRFVTRNGMQLLELAVPDLRAQRATEREAREKGISLARVRFTRLPQPQIPPVGRAAQATLTVSDLSVREDRQSTFDVRLNVPAATRLLSLAKSCEFIVVVLNPAGEAVHGRRQTRFFPREEGDQAACPRGDTLHLNLFSSWNGRLTDGQLAPAGRYQVRAGLRLTRKDGRIEWLSAPPAWLEVK
ncbi:hypothetical protein QOL99_12930 [Deinococcus sp. MIMF12]|uniref:Uncharacterized protein n=1 Tax=Deinococcus rhizophilus TaxID=3049544 RepID=A0ABT7JN07_9DEIO|nr:hypothetical protein [Deinococcus rhizophilus]MDL2345049.1 hypothetical protein [Deinococcus rhizophilus]